MITKSDNQVVVLGFLRFSPDKMQDVRPHLKNLVDETYKNDGCIAYDVAEDLFDAGLIRFSELWPDAQMLSAHLKAAHIEPWRVAAKECGLLERHFIAYSVTGSWAV